MSLCDGLPRANDINYCAGGAYYGTGILHIGTVAVHPVPLAVLFTNVATGRVQVVTLDDAELPEVTISQPSDLVPGQVYQIQVVGASDTQGTSPVEFTPYAYNATTGAFAAATTGTITGVNVAFVKVFDQDGEVHANTEQWITLQ